MNINKGYAKHIAGIYWSCDYINGVWRNFNIHWLIAKSLKNADNQLPVTSVSYTHLDVYKRQVRRRTNCVPLHD